MLRQRAQRRDDRVADRLGSVPAGQVQQDRVPARPLHQRTDRPTSGLTGEPIPLPMPGNLAAGRSNVVVLTTWFGGDSAGLLGWVGEGKLFDTSKFRIIIIDALGDGVSSSPSNSAEQPGEKFPRFTMRDMVRSQHELLTRELAATQEQMRSIIAEYEASNEDLKALNEEGQ